MAKNGVEVAKAYVTIVPSMQGSQAQIEKDYVDDYNVCVMYKDGVITQKKNIWSEYYFYDMPETLSVSFDGLEKGEYYIEIYANSFWKTTCKKPLRSEIFSL